MKRSSKTPYWYVLIEYWCGSLERTGLTLPYLVGVSKTFDALRQRSTLNLIDEIVEYDARQKIVAKYCNQIREFVFGIDDTIAMLFVKESKNYGNLIVPRMSADIFQFDDLRDLAQYLATIYDIHVEKSEYSKFGYSEWGSFSDEDLFTINAAFKNSGVEIF